MISRPEDAQTVADALAEYGNVRIVGAGAGSKIARESPLTEGTIDRDSRPGKLFVVGGIRGR